MAVKEIKIVKQDTAVARRMLRRFGLGGFFGVPAADMLTPSAKFLDRLLDTIEKADRALFQTFESDLALSLLVRARLRHGRHSEALLRALGVSSHRSVSRAVCIILSDKTYNYTHDFIKFLDALQALNDPGLVRKVSHAAHRAAGREFWFAFNFVKSVPSEHRRLQAFRALVRLYPDAVSSAVVLLGGINPDGESRPLFRNVIGEIIELATPRLNGWGLVTAIQLTTALFSPQRALDLIHQSNGQTEGADTKIQILIERADAFCSAARADATKRPAAIRALVSALVMAPDHVRTFELLNHTVDLVAQDSRYRVVQELAEFLDGADVLRNGIDIDLGHAFVASQMEPEWVDEDRRQAFYAAPSYAACTGRQLNAREVVQTAGALFWDKYNDDQPELYGTSRDRIELVRQPQWSHDLEDVLVYTDSGLNLVIDGTGRVVRPVSHGHATLFSGTRPAVINREYENLRAAGLLIGYGDDNYCHFLFDRAPLIEQILTQAVRPDIIVIEERLVGWCRALLDLLGEDIAVRPIHLKQYYSFKHIQLFTSTQHPGQFWTDAHKAVFARCVADAPVRDRRVFIKRPQGRRGIVNEAEIHAIAMSKGFELVALETLDTAAQRNLFAGAAFVTGVHGAGFSNMVFSRPGTKIVELVRKGYVTPSYGITAGRMGMPYAILLDEAPPTGSGSDGDRKFEDLEIDGQKFAALIDDMDQLQVALRLPSSVG